MHIRDNFSAGSEDNRASDRPNEGLDQVIDMIDRRDFIGEGLNQG
jgi:hypothetical protein